MQRTYSRGGKPDASQILRKVLDEWLKTRPAQPFGAPECAGSRTGYAGETAMTCSPGACTVPPAPG
jgi:hypothetical protein